MIDVPLAAKHDDNTPRRRLRALYDWVTRAAPSPPVPASKLGQGGMGVVYAARDQRLERTVALKTMASLAGDETARQRFWREARAAASVNHPNVCQIYEIGEHGGELFIAMELLEGEALSERLREGPLSVSEAIPIGLGVLAALSALHARGIVTDSFLVVVGLRPVSHATSLLSRTIVKWICLYVPVPWPAGIHTRPVENADDRR